MTHHIHGGGHRLRPILFTRRVFLTDLGRGVTAATVMAAVVGACSSSGSSDPANPGDLAATSGPRPASDTATTTAGSTKPAASSAPPAAGAVTQAPAATDAPAVTGRAGGGGPLQWRRASLGFVSAYVLVRGGEAAIVDTGISGSAPAILEALGGLGVGWGDVGHVILTHNHPDHIGGLGEVFDAAAGATGYAGAADLGGISSERTVVGVGDGDSVFGMQVIETPGHTPGSISLIDLDSGLLLVGDALNGGAAGAIEGPNDRFSADMELALASVRKLDGFEFTTALFGHGDPSEGDAATRFDELLATLG